MNKAPLTRGSQDRLPAADVKNLVARACDRIAPAWPLDRSIAVNPYWGWREAPVADAAATLGVLCGTRLTMPRAWFREQWQAGKLQAAHLVAAVERTGSAIGVEPLIAALAEPRADSQPTPLPLLSTWLDARQPAVAGMGWNERITQQVSDLCAAHFDEAQASWPPGRRPALFADWRDALALAPGLPWRCDRTALRRRLAGLPADPLDAVSAGLEALRLPSTAREHYLGALLTSVGGWAAWCAYRRWQARLQGGDDDALPQLLAVRLAWDWLLHLDHGEQLADAAWTASWGGAVAAIRQLAYAQQIDWLLQLAAEIAYQQPLAEALAGALADAPAGTSPAPQVQAVFCIDVRSEPMRRALERVDPAVQTRGFAGFFGLPVAYRPLGSALERPQLPGLLAPARTIEEAADARERETLAGARATSLAMQQGWSALRRAPAAGFALVEACGLGFAALLAADAFGLTGRRNTRWEDAGLPRAARHRMPVLAVGAEEGAALAQRVLRAMGLAPGDGLAPLVLLVGHGSTSRNNPHAAGLDCGACGGQAGDVNARALAQLLNRDDVREALAAAGAGIPAGTWFVAALHDTTTDEVRLFDTGRVPEPLQPRLSRLRAALDAASEKVRAERAPALGAAASKAAAPSLHDSLRRRSRDWAQLRPEWGLAGNAAFVVAPRERTRALDLQGRSFLHDYDWRHDEDGSTLELVMTAPMVVTNWINLQYHASVVDPQRYGSGNKLLHNVAAGGLGVFEGNGGDLRIGLPLQSVHDGSRWRHEPLRLSVFIEAPQAMIDAVIERHAVVRDLVFNGWLHLLRLDGDTACVEQRSAAGWRRLARAPGAP